MKPRLMMLLTEECMEAFIAESATATFANTPEGQTDFLRWLPGSFSEACLLIDLPTEEFRRESVPHLTGRPHRELLQRKLELHFLGLTFRMAEWQAREPANRRDDILLFSALQNPEPLQSWLDAMRTARIPLKGAYSLPQLGGRLVEKSAKGHVLLVSWQAASGLRQSFYHNRQLVFSRLTASRGSAGMIDATCADLPETCRYLASAGLLPGGATLEVRIIGQKADWPVLRKQLPKASNRHQRFLSLEALHRQMAISSVPDSADATRVWLAILAQHPPTRSYALPVHTQAYRLQRDGIRLKYAAMSGLITTMLCAGGWHWQAAQLESASQTQMKLNQGMQSEVASLAARMPEALATPAEMRATVEWLRRLEEQNPNPRDFLLPLSRALDQHPGILLDELSWQALSDGSPAIRIHIDCHLDNLENNPRDALAQIDRFRADLNNPNQTVQTLRLPAGSNPGDSLETRQDNAQEGPRFALEITWHRPG